MRKKRKKFIKNMVRGFAVFMVVLIGFAVWYSPSDTVTISEQDTELVSAENIDSGIQVTEIEIQPGDTFSTLMTEMDVPPLEQNSILASVVDVYDFTKLQAGKLLHVVHVEEALAAIDYDISDDKKIVIENIDGVFVAQEKQIEYETREVVKNVVINSSLFLDGSQAGLSDKTLIELTNIFQWDIDFAVDIQKEDSFSVIYEERKTLGGELISPGRIVAARFENQGTAHDAYYYETADGGIDYYTTDGESVKSQFLGSPITVGYISSGYSYSRLNPVTRQVRPHRALDYAAPKGTPVMAIADGKVTLAGWKGAYGITIETDHAGQYKSQYAHLSGVASGIKPGVTVSQGQIVGYVGSTGNSTGSHLQYALFKDGTPVNPLSDDLPAGESLTGADLAGFARIVEQYSSQLSTN